MVVGGSVPGRPVAVGCNAAILTVTLHRWGNSKHVPFRMQLFLKDLQADLRECVAERGTDKAASTRARERPVQISCNSGNN